MRCASTALVQCKGLNLTSASVMFLLISRWTPFPPVNSRDAPKRGAATWPQCSIYSGFNFVSSFAQGKCMPSLQEDPAAASLCLGCFCCAATMQGLELDLRFCDGKLDCFFCWSASPYLPWTPFWAVSGRDPPKRGPPPHQLRPWPFSRCWTPFWAVSGRDPPKRGPPPHQLRPLPFSRCWTPFWAVSGRDPPKRGPPPHQLRPLPFSRCWTPFWAVSGRDPPKRGPPPHQLRPWPFSRCWTPFWAVSGRDPPKRGPPPQGKCMPSLRSRCS